MEYFAPTDETTAAAVHGWKLVMLFDPAHKWERPSSMLVFKGTFDEYEQGNVKSTPVFRTNCESSTLCAEAAVKVAAAKSNGTDIATTIANIKTSSGRPAPEVCMNYPANWTDSSGHNCLNYESFAWCPNLADPDSYLAVLSSDGVGASRACCTCGGGQMRKVSEGEDSAAILANAWQPLKWTAARAGAKAVVEPGSKSASVQCTDAKDWRSQGGYGCRSYDLFEWCTTDADVGAGWHNKDDGSISEWANSDGTDAFEACCACGGGTREVKVDSSVTTVEVSVPTCEDVHGFETNVGGVSYMCTDLKQRDWCSSSKSAAENGWDAEWGDVANFIDANAGNGAGGMSARDACCECGGGRSVGMSTVAQVVRGNGEHGRTTSVLTLQNKLMIGAACGTLLLLGVVMVLAQRTGIGMNSSEGVAGKTPSSADAQQMTAWNDTILSHVDVTQGAHAQREAAPEGKWMNVPARTLPFASPHPGLSVTMGVPTGGLRSLGGVLSGDTRSRSDIAEADSKELAMWRQMAASGKLAHTSESAIVRADNDILSIL
jgi:hypothetical protein